MREVMWRRWGTGVLVAALALGAAACGDDDDSTAGSGDDGGAAPGEPAAYCEPFFSLQEALFDTPEDPAEGAAAVEEDVVPLADQLDAAATNDTRESIEGLTERVRHAVTPEGFEEVGAEFEEGGPIIQRLSEVQLAAADNCGYERIDVKAVDFAFEGVPDTLEPGQYAFVLENATENNELHEIGMVKALDDSLTLDEVFELEEDELFEGGKAEFVGFAFAPPGATGVLFTELEAATYFYACFIPVGSGGDEPDEDAPPHFTQGMQGELTVS